MSHTCADCGASFTPARADAAYCSSACRQRSYRKRNAGPVTGKRPNTIRNASPVTAAEATIDWNTLPGTAKDKAEVMRRQIRRELEKELSAMAKEYRAKCDENVAEYKRKLKAELNAQAEKSRASRDAEYDRYRKAVEAYRAKGLISPQDYKLIHRCLHPDSRESASDESLAKAFRIFNDDKIRVLLVKGADAAGMWR